MIGGQILEAVNNRREAVGEESQLLLEGIINGGSGEARYVFEAGAGPVVDDEEGEEGGAEGVEPPDVGFGADEGEEEGEGVEDDIGFAV